MYWRWELGGGDGGREVVCGTDLDRVLGWPDGDFRRVVDA